MEVAVEPLFQGFLWDSRSTWRSGVPHLGSVAKHDVSAQKAYTVYSQDSLKIGDNNQGSKASSMWVLTDYTWWIIEPSLILIFTLKCLVFSDGYRPRALRWSALQRPPSSNHLTLLAFQFWNAWSFSATTTCGKMLSCGKGSKQDAVTKIRYSVATVQLRS